MQLIRPAIEHLSAFENFRAEFAGKIPGGNGLDGTASVASWIAERENIPNADTFALTDGEKILGIITFRRLPDELLTKTGGHISYAVRPSERRRGHGKTMLTLCLAHCKNAGYDRVMISCSPQNAASRALIKSVGGQFCGNAYVKEDLELYWVKT